MAASFSQAPGNFVYDTTASQETGAVSTGIGLPTNVNTPSGTAIPDQRIGGTAFNLTVYNPFIPA
jgi:hypothetical protein